MPEKNPFDRISELIARAASYLFLVIVVIATYEVVMRYAFNAPTTWVHEVSVMLAAAAFVIGGPVVHQTRHHIAITFIFERMSPRRQQWASAIGSVLTLAFLLLLTYAATRQAWLSIEIVERSGTALNWPVPMILKSIFAIGAALMVVQTVVHLLSDIRTLRRHRI